MACQEENAENRFLRAFSAQTLATLFHNPEMVDTLGGGGAATGEDRSLWRFTDVVLIGTVSLVAVLAGLLAYAAILGAASGTSWQDVRQGAVELPPALFGAYVAGAAGVQGLAMIVALWVAGLLRHHYSWRDLWLQPLTLKKALECATLFVGLRALAVLMALALAAVGLTSQQASFIAPSSVSAVTATATLLFVGVLVPFAEEAFFRGVLYRWLRTRWGVRAGIVVSGLIFGAVHVEPATAIPAAVLGMGLAWIYERHKSLWSCTLVHALNNLSALVLLYLLVALGVPISPAR
jgi:uncharacterized protein